MGGGGIAYWLIVAHYLNIDEQGQTHGALEDKEKRNEPHKIVLH